MHAIVACMRLPFFKIFSNFAHFWPNFQIFCPFSPPPPFFFFLPFFWKISCMPFHSRIGPVYSLWMCHYLFLIQKALKRFVWYWFQTFSQTLKYGWLASNIIDTKYFLIFVWFLPFPFFSNSSISIRGGSRVNLGLVFGWIETWLFLQV